MIPLDLTLAIGWREKETALRDGQSSETHAAPRRRSPFSTASRKIRSMAKAPRFISPARFACKATRRCRSKTPTRPAMLTRPDGLPDRPQRAKHLHRLFTNTVRNSRPSSTSLFASKAFPAANPSAIDSAWLEKGEAAPGEDSSRARFAAPLSRIRAHRRNHRPRPRPDCTWHHAARSGHRRRSAQSRLSRLLIFRRQRRPPASINSSPF